MMRVLTNSERGTFACERRWAFRYLHGLSESLTPVPLRAGSLWHQCLAAYYRARCAMDADAIARDVIEPWREQRHQWVEQSMPDGARQAAHDEDDEIASLTTGMVAGYLQEFTGDKSWEIIAVETQVSRKLTLGSLEKIGSEYETIPWHYGGAVDLLVKHNGEVWLVEHKTTSHTDLNQYLRKLHWDPQIRGYAWALANPDGIDGWKEPVKVAGVIYNVARKKLPKEPRVLKSGGLERRADMDTTREAYLQTILKAGLNPDDYADQLETLRNKQFFARAEYRFTEAELVDFQADVTAFAERVRAASRQDFHPRQVSICMGFPAQHCPYSNICIEDGPIARRSFTTMEIRHAELTGELAEPWVRSQRLQKKEDEINDPFAD